MYIRYNTFKLDTIQYNINRSGWLKDFTYIVMMGGSVIPTRKPRKEISPSSISLMLSSAGNYKLLTSEEELILGKRVMDGEAARSKLLLESLSVEEVKELGKLVTDGKDARDTLIVSNERLVISIATKFYKRSTDVPLEDLIQEGNIGLIRAAEKFDYKRGLRFSTYASFWINQSIMRGIAERGKPIRLPAGILGIVHKAHKANIRLAGELQHPPTIKEVATDIGEDPVKLEEYLIMWKQPLSLDWKIGAENEEVDFGSFLTDGGMINADEDIFEDIDSVFLKVYNESLLDTLEEWIDTLSPRDALVVRLRFGLIDGTSWTLEEIGADIGITKERVRQIQDGALRELRLLLKEQNLSIDSFL